MQKFSVYKDYGLQHNITFNVGTYTPIHIHIYIRILLLYCVFVYIFGELQVINANLHTLLFVLISKYYVCMYGYINFDINTYVRVKFIYIYRLLFLSIFFLCLFIFKFRRCCILESVLSYYKSFHLEVVIEFGWNSCA